MKTVIGAFDTSAQAERAAQDLVSAGITRDDISLVANNEGGTYAPVTETTTDGSTVTGHAIGHDATVGAEWGAGIGFLVGLTGLAVPGLGWIAGAGWFMGTLLGAGTGAIVGGLVGALTSVGVPEEDATYYTESVRRGGVLLAVRAQDDVASQVATILNNGGAFNINERAAQYRQEGFVPSATYAAQHTARNVEDTAIRTEGSIPGIQTGGRAYDGTPDTRGITEKAADALTGDRIDDKTGKPV